MFLLRIVLWAFLLTPSEAADSTRFYVLSQATDRISVATYHATAETPCQKVSEQKLVDLSTIKMKEYRLSWVELSPDRQWLALGLFLLPKTSRANPSVR